MQMQNKCKMQNACMEKCMYQCTLAPMYPVPSSHLPIYPIFTPTQNLLSPKPKIFVPTQNFTQTQNFRPNPKFSPKPKIFAPNPKFSPEPKIFARTQNFCPNTKFWPELKILNPKIFTQT